MTNPRRTLPAFFLVLLLSNITDLAQAQRQVTAPVLETHQLDPNDGKHPIHHREGETLVARPGVYPYAYGPTVLFDDRDKQFKMWAGVGWNGDTISFKQAPSLAALDAQPWEIALEPRRTEPVADQDHCCDPCVISADGGYYLYYSGAGRSERWPNGQTYVMVAFSKDGRRFDLLNNGVPVVDMGKAYQPVIGYGVGQPAVTLGPDDWYYMLYTYSADNQYSNDTTNYLGVIRSRKPDFIQHEEVTRLPRRLYGCSNDLVYDAKQQTMVMVCNESHPARGVQVRFVSFSPDFKLLDDCHILNTDLTREVFGEGLGILTDPQRRWLYPAAGPATVTITGATYAKREGMPVEHIAGPTVAVTWQFHPGSAQPAESKSLK